MSISMTTWDRWAPAAYLFVIGVTIGFVTGLGIGLTSDGGSGVIYIVLLPIAVILILFVVLVFISKRIGRRVKN